jgi:hypothetical protein
VNALKTLPAWSMRVMAMLRQPFPCKRTHVGVAFAAVVGWNLLQFVSSCCMALFFRKIASLNIVVVRQ